MAMNFEDRMALLVKRNNLKLEWQALQHGFHRARITCDSSEELSAVLRLARSMKGVWLDHWSCYEGEFEGYVYMMDAGEQEQMNKAQEMEQRRLNDWWTRYHLADAESRQLMACGTIE